MFTPSRLALARNRRRLTRKRLAELSGISQVTLSRIENGKNIPDQRTLEALAAVLRFPLAFFSGDEIDELPVEAASFRSLTAMTARERDAALAAGSLAYIFADWVKERFNLPVPDLPDQSHTRTPSAAARELRQQWGLGERPVGNMLQLLESKGIRVFSLSENSFNVDAFSCWRNGEPYVFLNTIKSAEHSRFDAAHELGHLLLHKHGGHGSDRRSAETEANAFASSFLMPETDVVSHIPLARSLNELVNAKRRWGVSVAALAYRLHKIGIVSDWQYRSLCITLNRNGYRKNEPNGIDRESSFVWKTVFTELWKEQITKAHVAEDLGIPVDELESLVFGLIQTPGKAASSNSSSAIPGPSPSRGKLKLV